MSTHVFLAPLGAAFGEALHGVRLAAAVQAAGDQAIFLGPACLGPLLSGVPLRFGRIDAALPHLHGAVRDLLRGERAKSLILVDLAGVAQASLAFGFDLNALLDQDVPVLALDCWDLAAAGLSRDLGPEDQSVGPTGLLDHAALRDRRLLPVPFVHPATPGAYNALPQLEPSPAERELVRADLGLAAADRLVLFPSARWQHQQDQPDRRRLAAVVPELLLHTLAALPETVRVLHIGPEPYPAGPLQSRYRHVEQVTPTTFNQLLQAADLLLSINAAATTLGTALCADVPVLLVQNAVSGATLDQAQASASAAGGTLSPTALAWLPRALPLPRLRACPLSLDRFLRPIMRHNPLYDSLRTVQLLDEAALLKAASDLLFDAKAAQAQRGQQAAYVAQVRRLPDGLTLLRRLLAAAQPAVPG